MYRRILATMWRRAIVFAVTACAAVQAHAAPLLNELLVDVRVQGTATSGYDHEWIELFETGAGSGLGGWLLRFADGSTLALPGIALPAGGFLTVHLAAGTNDFDWSDGEGDFYAGASPERLADTAGEVALYSGTPSGGTIADYVAWNGAGPFVPGASYADATAAGIWTAGSTVDIGAMNGNDTIGRVFDGWSATPWLVGSHEAYMVRAWERYARGGVSQPGNPFQYAPAGNAFLASGALVFEWPAVAWADSFQLQVASDPTFSVPAVDVKTTATSHAVSLVSGPYFHRMRAFRGALPSGWSSPWFFFVNDPAAGGVTPVDQSDDVDVTHIYQHKDTHMLCLYGGKWQPSGNTFVPAAVSRPGCNEGVRTTPATLPWDGPHPNAAPEGGDRLDQNYCTRASIAMLNNQYGGTLSQDRISYEFHKDVLPGPELDLGFNMGTYPRTTEQSILSWALNGAAITLQIAPESGFSFSQLRSWVNERDFFMATLPGHTVVVDGYRTYAWGLGTVRVIVLQDPWRGPNFHAVHSYDGVGTAYGLGRQFQAAFLQPVSGVTGRAQEAAVTLDSDLDGVVDFDETQRFFSNPNDADTDHDEVADLRDIRSYTFYTCGDNDALNFPDVDGDGRRAELDCDSDHAEADGTGQFDGGEDVQGLGVCSGPTDPFVAADDGIFLAPDKPAYFVGETVKLLGSRYHTTSTYPGFLTGGPCPDLADSTAIPGNLSLSSDATGTIPPTAVMTCIVPGPAWAVLDVLKDGIYVEPDNWDPIACWACLGFWIPPVTFDDDDTWDDDDTGINPYSATTPRWQYQPFPPAGRRAVLNPMTAPGQPVNCGLRMPLVPPQGPGSIGFLAFDQQFNSPFGLQGHVRVSFDDGMNWQVVAVFDQAHIPPPGRVLLDLTPFLPGRGPNAITGTPDASASMPGDMLVEFLAIGPPDSGMWFLDNVKIGGVDLTSTDIAHAVPAPPFALHQNVPNPFNPTTSITFDLPADGEHARLEIFDVRGRSVRSLVDAVLPKGRHSVVWEGTDRAGRRLPSGVYFYRLQAGVFRQVQRMTLVR